MSDAAAKVLYVSFDVLPDATGTSARATEILRGISPVFAADALTAKTPDHSHIERYFGVRLLRVPVGSGDVPARAQAFERAVRRQLESDEYDLVQFSDPHGGYAVCELKAELGYKTVYAPAGFPSIELRYTHPELEGNRKFLAKLQRQELYCLMNADAVVVPSEVTRAYALALGVPESRLQVVPPPVDLKLFGEVPEPPAPTPFRLLYLGSMAPWQGLTSLLFAMRTATQRADVRLAVVGPRLGSWRRQLEELVRELGLGNRVELSDPVPHEEVPRLLGQAHACVAPLERSDRNVKQGAAPLKIAEALVAGRPVIASDLPVTRAMLETGVHGTLVPPGDEPALARAILDLALDAPKRQRLAAAARRHGRARFDADLSRKAHLLVFHDLIDPSVVVSPELLGDAAPAESSDRYTVSSMPTTLTALPEGTPGPSPESPAASPAPAPAAPDDGAAQGDAAAPPTRAESSDRSRSRKQQLRPRLEVNPHEWTSPGSKVPPPVAKTEHGAVGGTDPAIRMALADLSRERVDRRPREPTTDPGRAGPPAEGETPVGPAPGTPRVAGRSDGAGEDTPIGPPPQDPAEPPADAPEVTPVGPPPLPDEERPDPLAMIDLTPVGPPPIDEPGVDAQLDDDEPLFAVLPPPPQQQPQHQPPKPPQLRRPSAPSPPASPPNPFPPRQASGAGVARPRPVEAPGPAGRAAFFDRLARGEVVPPAASRTGDADEAPSQIVVGELVEEDAPGGAAEARAPKRPGSTPAKR